MSRNRLVPPEPESCLTGRLSSSTRGGTVIAEEVWSPAAHARRLSDPDGYRPDSCLRCGGCRLHVHDYRQRKPPDGSPVTAARYRCAEPTCRATWQVLPAFVARHLWFSWPAVEAAALDEAPATASAVKPSGSTLARWKARLSSSARQLRTLMVEAAGLLMALALQVPLDGTRRVLVLAYAAVSDCAQGQLLGKVAAQVDRLQRGVRLM